jgi:predicted transcriptional regulator
MASQKIYLDGTEKSMIPIIKNNADNFVSIKKGIVSLEEFSCGTGISDLTIFTIDNKILSEQSKSREKQPITSKNQIHVFLALLTNKYVSVSEIMEKVNINNKHTVQTILARLVKNKLVINKGKKYKAVKNTIFNSSENIIAIEAKVRNWKSGIRQAMRYKEYADYSYLAIYEKHISACLKNIKIFKKLGIGLIGVSDDGVKVYLKASLSNMITNENKILAFERFLSIVDKRYKSFVARNNFITNYST